MLTAGDIEAVRGCGSRAARLCSWRCCRNSRRTTRGGRLGTQWQAAAKKAERAHKRQAWNRDRIKKLGDNPREVRATIRELVDPGTVAGKKKIKTLDKFGSCHMLPGIDHFALHRTGTAVPIHLARRRLHHLMKQIEQVSWMIRMSLESLNTHAPSDDSKIAQWRVPSGTTFEAAFSQVGQFPNQVVLCVCPHCSGTGVFNLLTLASRQIRVQGDSHLIFFSEERILRHPLDWFKGTSSSYAVIFPLRCSCRLLLHYSVAECIAEVTFSEA